MSPIPRILSTAFGTVFIVFGFNAILRPENALSFFELDYGAFLVTNTQQLAHALLAVYGIRDVFMGLVIYAVAYYGNRKALGWVVLLASAVAIADGAVCKIMVGSGEWNHWGYAPILSLVGAILVLG